VLGGVADVEPAAEDRDRPPSGLKRPAMRRRVDPAGESRDDGHAGSGETCREVPRRGEPRPGGAARPDDGDGGCRGERDAEGPEVFRGARDLAKKSGVLGIARKDLPSPASPQGLFPLASSRENVSHLDRRGPPFASLPEGAP